MFSIISCQKEDIVEPQTIDIFKVEQSTLSNKSEISFNVETEGVYIITIIDKNTNQVLSREKIKCIIGKNKIKIYTKSLQSRYLYLLLEDVTKKEISKEEAEKILKKLHEQEHDHDKEKKTLPKKTKAPLKKAKKITTKTTKAKKVSKK